MEETMKTSGRILSLHIDGKSYPVKYPDNFNLPWDQDLYFIKKLNKLKIKHGYYSKTGVPLKCEFCGNTLFKFQESYVLCNCGSAWRCG